MSSRLSVAAVLLGIAAVALGLIFPGPTGPVGSAGPAGPAGSAGPGTLTANNSLRVFQGIGASCTWYAGSTVRLVVPGPGTIVVSGVVKLVLEHSFGTQDVADVVVANATADCPFDSYT